VWGDEEVREALARNVKAVERRPGVARGTATTKAVLLPPEAARFAVTPTP
jgi:hypothetical protein